MTSERGDGVNGKEDCDGTESYHPEGGAFLSGTEGQAVINRAYADARRTSDAFWGVDRFFLVNSDATGTCFGAFPTIDTGRLIAVYAKGTEQGNDT